MIVPVTITQSGWIQDTPELESKQVHKAICDYVAAQDKRYLNQQQESVENCSISEKKDPRVDVCLAFLNPHAVKAHDIALMQDMSKLGVPVVQVIAKVRHYTCSHVHHCAYKCLYKNAAWFRAAQKAMWGCIKL